MGPDQRKLYLTFENPIEPRTLPDVKNFTNAIERRLATNGNRCVNIDPGYLTRDKLVLATTKDFFHRLYLRDGIYGEVTLHFRKGRYRYFSWTYPDYREPGFQVFLMKARSKLVHELRLSDPGD